MMNDLDRKELIAINCHCHLPNARKGLRLLVLFILLAIFAWSIFHASQVSQDENNSYRIVNTDWMQFLNGQRTPLGIAQDAQITSSDAPIILEYTLPTLDSPQNLDFYAFHQDVHVYLEDVLIYQLTCPAYLSFLESPGRVWVDIPFTASDSGKTLRFEFYSPIPVYHDVPSAFYLTPASQVLQVQANFMWMRNIAAFVILFIGLITYGNALIWKGSTLYKYLCALADVYFFSGLWLFAESNILPTFLGSTSLCTLFAMVFLRVIPVVFHQLICTTINGRPLWLTVLGIVSWLNLLGSLLLQFCFGVSLVRTLPFSVYLMLGSSLVYFLGIGHQIFSQKVIHLRDWACYASLMLPMSVFAEGYCFFNHATLGKFNGLFVTFACMAYSGVAHVLLVKQEAITDVEKHKLKKHQDKLERKPLTQQINAHFLFNTLNTISAYCKESPQKADRAVQCLAQYMRRYMHMVNRGDDVSFNEELLLVKLYLEIQNMRYIEDITIVVDAPFQDFLLPPLTLQPLVENAVSHGIHSKGTDGIIWITTNRYGENIEVIVKDNGKGFAYEKGTEFTGVSIGNLTKRIHALGGSLQIKSAPGKGTQVAIQLPLLPIENKETGLTKGNSL